MGETETGENNPEKAGQNKEIALKLVSQGDLYTEYSVLVPRGLEEDFEKMIWELDEEVR